MNALEAARAIAAAQARGQEVVSVLLVSGAAAGARVIVTVEGTVTGSFPDGAVDDAAIALARDVFTSRQPILSGQLFAELHAVVEPLLIFGAGHIAVPLAELAVKLGFAVTVLDDRDEFAQEARFPAAAHVRTLDFADPLADVDVGERSYIVLVTRAHKYDFDCLKAVLTAARQPRYIGMIGSRRRVRAAFSALLEGGIARAQLERVHAPVGLDIGAETPAEIAVSIAAELIRVRRGGSAASLAGDERVLARFFAEAEA